MKTEEQIDLVWLNKYMEPDIWYEVSTEEEREQLRQIIDKKLFFPKFTLIFSKDYKFIKKHYYEKN